MNQNPLLDQIRGAILKVVTGERLCVNATEAMTVTADPDDPRCAVVYLSRREFGRFRWVGNQKPIQDADLTFNGHILTTQAGAVALFQAIVEDIAAIEERKAQHALRHSRKP